VTDGTLPCFPFELFSTTHSNTQRISIDMVTYLSYPVPCLVELHSKLPTPLLLKLCPPAPKFAT
jgi:hypothetical protein